MMVLGLGILVYPMAKRNREIETAFNRYTLTKVVGNGGAGDVWQATDSANELVAVKILRAANANPERRKRFQNEITFCQHAKHANIVKVLDYGVTEQAGVTVPFYVMPLFSGSLRKIMDEQPDPATRLRYVDQLLSGVEAAHLKNVTHRDLKPENVLHDDKSDTLLVADFGIAHFMDEEIYTAVDTKDSTRLANFLYAAPEQRVRGRSVSNPADIYSLGLILNELFTGEVPQGVDYKEIGSVLPAFSWLDEVVHEMIQADPSQRPTTIDAVKQLLDSRSEAFTTRQQLSEIENRVIPVGEEDDPLALVPPRVTSVGWDAGRLTLGLDKAVNDQWIQHGLHNMGGHTSVMGAGPRRFDFTGKSASVTIDESGAQKTIDYFKDWLPRATEAYRQYRERRRQQAAHDERERLRREKEALEVKQRINAKLKI